MTRLTRYVLPTEKQAPADAEALSHKLLVRAGMVRQLGAGLWTWLPAGWRVHRKVEQVIREEMDAIGCGELLMPVLQPAELWRRTGRYGFDEQFRLQDRRGAEMVLALTHEEAVTFHVSSIVRSYRDLPRLLYHFQVKERDEPRPRAGVLRTREFVMKDAYSFDRDEAGLAESYDRFREAYARVYDRAGIEWYACRSDVGMMGGTDAHEYMAPCAAGEDDVVLAGSYAANLEVAVADAQPVAFGDRLDAPEEVRTPGLTTVAQVAGHLGIPAGGLLKSMPFWAGEELVLVVVRGDHQVNETKLRNHFGAEVRQAQPSEFERIGPAGYLGPVGADVPVWLDSAAEGGTFVVGANQPDAHLRGVEPGRDFPYVAADLREVVAGDTVAGAPVRIEPAIEIGNVFKLGTRYSVPLEATYLDEDGKAQPIVMGSYGIGPARIAAAAVEQFADEQGISWPRAIAPFDVHVVALGKPGTPERAAADGLYDELRTLGVDVLYDDREGGAGGKFADAELLGVPLRVTVGRKALEAGTLEVQVRRGREVHELPLDGGAEETARLWRTLQ